MPSYEASSAYWTRTTGGSSSAARKTREISSAYSSVVLTTPMRRQPSCRTIPASAVPWYVSGGTTREKYGCAALSERSGEVAEWPSCGIPYTANTDDAMIVIVLDPPPTTACTRSSPTSSSAARTAPARSKPTGL